MLSHQTLLHMRMSYVIIKRRTVVMKPGLLLHILPYWANFTRMPYGNQFMQTLSHDVAEHTLIIVKRTFALPCAMSSDLNEKETV